MLLARPGLDTREVHVEHGESIPRQPDRILVVEKLNEISGGCVGGVTLGGLAEGKLRKARDILRYRPPLLMLT